VPEPAASPLGGAEVVRGRPRHPGHGLHDQLGDAITAVDLVVVVGVGVDEEDLELVPVARVDEAGRVEAGDAVAQGQAAAGLHEPGVALGEGEGDPGRDQRPAAASAQHRSLSGQDVEAGVALLGVGGQRQLGVEVDHGHGEGHGHGRQPYGRTEGRWPAGAE
jgi:hypothetical protein